MYRSRIVDHMSVRMWPDVGTLVERDLTRYGEGHTLEQKYGQISGHMLTGVAEWWASTWTYAARYAGRSGQMWEYMWR